MSHEGLDHDVANQKLANMEAPERIQWASETFQEGLFALTSFGVDSALLLRLIQKGGVEVPVITIDTGLWLPETHTFKDELTERFGL